MTNKKNKLKNTKNRQAGYTLLEYCAGAALILVTIWGALNAMGQNISGMLASIGTWATERSAEIQGANGQGGTGQSGTGSGSATP